ncbi:hypothetical protein AAC387_Pa02g1522 [Persea americana]
MLPSHVFSANPLSLSLPDSAFESWLRDEGYLEILDERTTARASIPTSSTAPSSPSNPHSHTRRSPALVLGRIFSSLVSVLTTFVSLVTISPFAKLTADDFAGVTPSWTVGFVGYPNSYSWPSDPSQARMRVHENVKRYARCYSLLALVFFACSLYQIPLALFGVISSLALWEGFRFCCDRWGLESHAIVRQILLRLIQFATAIILFSCNLQVALFWAVSISYIVMILHASLRKLTPKQPDQVHKRFLKNKYRT